MVLEQSEMKTVSLRVDNACLLHWRIEKPHSLANIKKAKTILNYQPKYNLEKGLKEAVDWYWKNLKR